MKKTTTKKIAAQKTNPLNQTTNLKLGSPPCKKLPMSGTSKQKLARSKSNYLFVDEKKNPSRIIGTEKKIGISRSRVTSKPNEKRDPVAVIQEFIKQDLREVLDLSRCELNDNNIYDYLYEVRKHRKMRGLKLSQNNLTDAGFIKIMDLLNSTSNLNLSYNKMTEEILTLLSKNKDKLATLRIINLSFNQVNEKKAHMKLDGLKKIGFTINL